MINIKEANKVARQGEAFFLRVPSMPEGVKEISAENGKLIVSHSETGHDHVVEDKGVKFYQHPADPLIAFLMFETAEFADVVHKRDYDTHDTVRLLGKPGTIWQRNLQREWTPEGWEQVMD